MKYRTSLRIFFIKTSTPPPPQIIPRKDQEFKRSSESILAAEIERDQKYVGFFHKSQARKVKCKSRYSPGRGGGWKKREKGGKARRK